MPWRKQDTLSLLLRLRGDFDGDAPRGGTTRLRTGYATVGGIAQAHGLFCATLPLYMPKLIHLAFREPVMLIKRRCPHTGVVNFFSHAEPHMAVGSIVPRKAYRNLIAALDGLADLPWTLTIAGDDTRHPDETTALKAQIAASPAGARIRLLGALSNAALAELYATSDAFVMSSLYEGYGMVLGEALAHGLPIVATRAGAAAETVPDGAALKVEPGDVTALNAALRRVIADADLRRQLADQSWSAGQRLPQWRDTARRIADVVERVAREEQ